VNFCIAEPLRYAYAVLVSLYQRLCDSG